MLVPLTRLCVLWLALPARHRKSRHASERPSQRVGGTRQRSHAAWLPMLWNISPLAGSRLSGNLTPHPRRGGLFPRAISRQDNGHPTIEGPVDLNPAQRGLFSETEPLEILEQKLDHLAEETRGPGVFLRDDIPRPLRIPRGDIVSFNWGTSRKLNTVVITTKFDELEFCFDARYIGHAEETAAILGYAISEYKRD
jgi:hypothetical protein